MSDLVRDNSFSPSKFLPQKGGSQESQREGQSSRGRAEGQQAPKQTATLRFLFSPGQIHKAPSGLSSPSSPLPRWSWSCSPNPVAW